MEHDDLVTFTADIVSAHISKNQIDAADLPELISTVYAALAGLGSSEGRVRQRGVISAVALGHRHAAFAVMCRG